jgi:PleD family two-component response regulator
MEKERSQAIKEVSKSQSRETRARAYLGRADGRAQDATGGASAFLPDPAKARVLIVSDDDAMPESLEMILRDAGVSSERVTSMTAGCESARSGRFKVVVTISVLSDGTWKRLTDLASHHRPGFAVIVVATAFDFKKWAAALADGAFEVVDSVNELPRVGEAVKRALWAAYLEGVGPFPDLASQRGTVRS